MLGPDVLPAALASALRRQVAGAALAEDRATLTEFGVAPITGGFNNHVFAAEIDGRLLCLKIHRMDDRWRDWREWQALTLLHRHLPGLAPEPYGYDTTAPPDIVAMARLDGVSLGGERPTPTQLDALFAALTALHELRPGPPLPPLLDAAGTPAIIGSRVMTWAYDSATEPPYPEIEAARDLARRWLAVEGQVFERSTPSEFSRGDPNLANCLWHAGRLRLIDFEYSGWNERAFELADHVEHIAARCLPDDDWLTLVERFRLSRGEWTRFEAARRLLALFWCLLLAPRLAAGTEPPERFAAQFERARRLTGPVLR